MTQGKVKRVLVICPLSIMDSAWRNDLFSFAMHRTVDVAYGAKEKRRKIINQGSDYVVINYDGVEIVAEDIANGGSTASLWTRPPTIRTHRPSVGRH